jgi:VWFA-related protein
MLDKRIRLGTGLVLAFGLGVVLTVQAPAEQAPQTRGRAEGSKPQKPDFKVSIDLVNMDVIVRNAQDRFVADLTKDDFEVFEDGVKQEVTAFTLVHGGRVHNLLASPPSPSREGIVLPASRPRNDAAGRIFLIIVDDLHLDFGNTARIRDLFKRIANTLVHEGDMFAIVSTGPSSLAIDPTYGQRIEAV